MIAALPPQATPMTLVDEAVIETARFALPDAPMAMPLQEIEPEAGLLRRLLSHLLPGGHNAPSAGARL